MRSDSRSEVVIPRPILRVFMYHRSRRCHGDAIGRAARKWMPSCSRIDRTFAMSTASSIREPWNHVWITDRRSFIFTTTATSALPLGSITAGGGDLFPRVLRPVLSNRFCQRVSNDPDAGGVGLLFASPIHQEERVPVYADPGKQSLCCQSLRSKHRPSRTP